LLIATAFASCTDETESFVPKGTPLQLNVKTASIETRGLIESATLPDGEAHTIGLTLVDAGEVTYDGRTYNNIKSTPSTVDGKQTWAMASDIYLSSTTGTLYGYYPYSSSVTNIEQIPVTAGETDYMYATPVNNLDDGKYTASVTMNHALAAIRLNIVRGTYTGTGSVTAVSVKGDNIATSGKLNAKTGTLSGQTGAGTAITYSTAFTLSTTAKQIDQIIVPVTSSSAAPTFTATIDGKDYTATPATVTLAQGTVYEYTLTVNAKEISLSDVTVGDWGYNSSGNPVINAGYNITLAGDTEGIAFNCDINTISNLSARADTETYTILTIYAVPVDENKAVSEISIPSLTVGSWGQQMYEDGKLRVYVYISDLKDDLTIYFNGTELLGTIDLTTANNGVYAVAQNGKGVSVEDADESCIAVALIVTDADTPQRLMIEKNGEANTTSIKAAYTEDGASNTSYTYFFWGMYGSDNTSITNYTQTGGGGTSSYGYLPKADGTYQSTPNLSGDYTTWTSGALSDFNGKANTAALLAASDTDIYTTYANMATWCRIFNQTATENQGYTDWYIPACGQLSLMYLNMTAIDNALTKIGGQTISSGNYWNYWSSSECSSNNGWYVYFTNGTVNSNYKYTRYYRVRFVRDI